MSEVSSKQADCILIEKMEQSDIEDVQKIEREGNLSPWSYEGYIEELLNQDSICLVAKVNKRIVGFMISRLIMLNHSIDLYNISVLSEFRNQNIATRLLNTLDKLLKVHDSREIWLEVRESNMVAINFYKKNNFKEISKRKSFYINPIEDAIVMCKSKDSKNNLIVGNWLR